MSCFNDTPADVAWSHWLTNVEFELGHELEDGDTDVDGFSLELARKLFEDDFDVAEAVEEIESLKERARGPGLAPWADHIFLED